MPNISIREQEETIYRAFDATENTVLIPLLYARAYTKTKAEGSEEETVTYLESDDIKGILFSSVNDFKTALSGHYVYTDEATIDRSYAMAYELLLAGLNVVIKPITFDNADKKYHGNDGTAVNTYIDEEAYFEILEKAINENGAYEEFRDRNIFNIKFITSGAYMNKGAITNAENSAIVAIDKTMVEIAEARGDAIALVELRPTFENKSELISELKEMTVGEEYMYSACFFPWCTFTTAAGGITTTTKMPACFAYLKAYANSIKSNANWFAASGVTRGQIPDMVAPTFDVGEALMHILQGDIAYDNTNFLQLRVNPIYNAGSYGYRIWGNRTTWASSTSTKLKYQEFLNVRVLLCDIKKQTFHAAMRTTFEPNDDIVWINFKGLVNTLLEQMVSGRGLMFYRWTKQKADDKATIKATLTIRPIEAVESFDINVVLTEDETTLTESV